MRQLCVTVAVVFLMMTTVFSSGVVAQDLDTLQDRVSVLEREVAALKKALQGALTALAELSNRVPARSSKELAAKSRAAMEKTCTDVGLKFKGVTAQQQPTQTVVVQCVP